MERREKATEDVLISELQRIQEQQSKTALQIHAYGKLKDDLFQISKASSLKVIVPITGPGMIGQNEDVIAYFPDGKLKHTNEILVHLGADYYVQRTAFECSEIIDRRVQLLTEKKTILQEDLEKSQILVGISTAQGGHSGKARLNEEGLLEIEEPFEEPRNSVLNSQSKKIIQVPGIQYIDEDPFARPEPKQVKNQQQYLQTKKTEIQSQAVQNQVPQKLQPVKQSEFQLPNEFLDHPKSILKKPSIIQEKVVQIQELNETCVSETPFTMQIVERDQNDGTEVQKPSKRVSKFAQERLKQFK